MSPLSNAVLATFLLLVPVTWSGPLLAQTNDTTASSPGTGDAAAGSMTLSRIKELYFEAAREGRDDLLGGLLKSGVLQPDARNPQGYTALILAAYNEHPGTVDFLIGKGADACATDPKGNSSLMGVAFKGDAEIATRLIAAHCDVNAVNGAGQTALMMAALFGRTDVIKVLLAHGADPSRRDQAGNTAALLAQQQGSTAVVELLKNASRG